MSSSTNEQKTDYESFSPEDLRMTIGEHLEELRKRLIFAIIGFAVILGACLFYGQQVLEIFCWPMIYALKKNGVSTQLYYPQASDAFMVYVNVSMISAAAVAAPWIVYQLWLFVAAGLYPKERKYITKYVPLSVGLLIAGMLFVYFIVLPMTLDWLIEFGNQIPLHYESGTPTTQVTPMVVPSMAGDPVEKAPYQIWFDTTQSRLKMWVDNKVRVVPFGPENLTSPMIMLPDYIDMVVAMLLTFGLSFQLPLAVLTLERIGIVELEGLRKWRKYVYFAMAIIAAVITPGDVLMATVLLMVPLCLLYEFGIFLCIWKKPKKAEET